MEYNFKEIEPKWQRRWRENKTYKVETDPSRPKFYVLDMFPYPSGAGQEVDRNDCDRKRRKTTTHEN